MREEPARENRVDKPIPAVGAPMTGIAFAIQQPFGRLVARNYGINAAY